jgi:CheY-like chemotaxis protein
MNGIEFIHKFRTHQACAQVPVVMVTSDEDPIVRREALAAGAAGFIVKPVDHHECRRLCINLLKQQRC